MKPLALALLLAIAASWAGPADCTPDCCRAADGSAMASCPMRGSSSGECQLRECSPESSANQPVTAQVAVLAPSPARLALLASGEAPLPPARRIPSVTARSARSSASRLTLYPTLLSARFARAAACLAWRDTRAELKTRRAVHASCRKIEALVGIQRWAPQR